MNPGVLGIDLYQLTTLVTHASLGLLDPTLPPVGMSFFFRKLPPHRNYVVMAGLPSILHFCAHLQFQQNDWQTLWDHPFLGPTLRTPIGQQVVKTLESIQGFSGSIDALPEGTLAFAGPAYRQNGEPLLSNGNPFYAYTPLLQVRTSLAQAKLLETPLMSRLNYFSMVASKASRIVSAAQEDGVPRSVFEFGQRRTHPAAAMDAAYAAYLAGCDATSNLAATQYHGIPSVGTIDHFAIQALEQANVPHLQTEALLFARFCKLFPTAATLLVDTYDPWQGIRNAVTSTRGRLTGIRLDSNVTADTVKAARQILQTLQAPHVKIIVSDRLDEWRIRELAQAGADGFGVGENLVCSSDSPTGIGAVGKLVLNAFGELPIKTGAGAGKRNLPGLLQAYRYANYDFLCFADEPPPLGGIPLLQPVWRGNSPVSPLPTLADSRQHVKDQLSTLPCSLRALEVSETPLWRMVLSDKVCTTLFSL